MANEDHIAQLMRGVAAWNAWREENPDVQPDLSGADLGDEILREANLNGACLDEVVRPVEVCVGEVRIDEDCPFEIRPSEVRTLNRTTNLRGARPHELSRTGFKYFWRE
jgi:uncharacterized protein YjbI with pentapeptide repeats